jgi:hypothetical protein
MNASDTNNALILTTLLLGLIDRAGAIGKLLQTAQAQGRDITAAELDELAAEDDAARIALDQAIKAARSV